MFKIDDDESPSFVALMRPDGEKLVSFYLNGEVKFGPHYSPEEAARGFWTYLSQFNPYYERIHQLEKTVALLNSMVEAGEQHSDTSRAQVRKALNERSIVVDGAKRFADS